MMRLSAVPTRVIHIVKIIEVIIDLSVNTAAYDLKVNSTGHSNTFLAAIARLELNETESI
jgi:hypothetical protein